MNYPDPCVKCRAFGGRWMEGFNGGMTNCDCPRGRAFSDLIDRPYRESMVSTETATICMEMMAGINYFPTEEGSRAVVVKKIVGMCENDEQAKWLAIRMVRLYRKWPGVPELRLVFTSTHTPLDGIAAIGESEIYPDGIPSERKAETKAPRLLAGKPEPSRISGAPSLENTVRDLADAKNMNRIGPLNHVRDIPLRRLRPEERITPEMLREAVQKHRQEQARTENQETEKELEDAEKPGSAEGL